MSAEKYLDGIEGLIGKIRDTQLEAIDEAAEVFATSIASGKIVHAFGSGHSVLPVMDLFPRYGAYVGFHPIMDSRLMWTTPVGSGGAPEVLWQERQEGYIDVMLPAHKLEKGDSILIFSHGGLNPAPVEMALAAKARGMTVVAVTSERIGFSISRLTRVGSRSPMPPTSSSTTVLHRRMHSYRSTVCEETSGPAPRSLQSRSRCPCWRRRQRSLPLVERCRRWSSCPRTFRVSLRTTTPLSTTTTSNRSISARDMSTTPEDLFVLRSERVMLPGGWAPAEVACSAGRITSIDPIGTHDDVVNLGAMALAPGYVDVQINGG